MDGHQIILGAPWLRKHNPTIDWKKRSIIFSPQCKKDCTRKDPETPSRRNGRNERNEFPRVLEVEEHPSIEERQLASTTEIPPEYQDLENAFAELKDEENLPEH